MSTWHPYVCRNPKFSDDFERDMANDVTYHLGRDEPCQWQPLLQRIGQRMSTLIRSARLPCATISSQGSPGAYALLTKSRPWSAEAP